MGRELKRRSGYSLQSPYSTICPPEKSSPICTLRSMVQGTKDDVCLVTETQPAEGLALGLLCCSVQRLYKTSLMIQMILFHLIPARHVRGTGRSGLVL